MTWRDLWIYLYIDSRVQEPYMGFARIFQKIPRLIRRRPNFMFQMQDFQSYKWQKKSICAGLSAMISPPKNCHFASSFIFFKKKIQKNSKRMRWTSSEYFLKTHRLQLMSFLNTKISRLYTGCNAFLQKQSFAQTRPKLEFLLLWTCKVLGSKQTFEWKYRSQKVELETCKKYSDQKCIRSKFIPPFNCACLNHSWTLIDRRGFTCVDMTIEDFFDVYAYWYASTKQRITYVDMTKQGSFDVYIYRYASTRRRFTYIGMTIEGSYDVCMYIDTRAHGNALHT